MTSDERESSLPDRAVAASVFSAERAQVSPSSGHPPSFKLGAATPLSWLKVFGPGAIIASLTIGTGELIFSSRGGAIFGYRILFLFFAISLLKWTLVYSAARHMVLSGMHPIERWMHLPFGPRGWLPIVLFLFAALCIPVWVGFHASVLGNLISSVSGTTGWSGGAMDQVWGLCILLPIVALSLTGGYAALEKIQLAVVGLMLLAVVVTLILLRPDWVQLLAGIVIPQKLEYPNWLLQDPRPTYRAIASDPVWIEATLYVGVVGGASYDYLAYVSFLREKKWGLAGNRGEWTDLQRIADDPAHPVRAWVRAPLIDCTISFLVVLVFSAVFVAAGTIILGPARQIPGDGNFLEHQAQFVTKLHPWLYPLYAAGALLTLLGTLYGTLEVAPTILRETRGAMARAGSSGHAQRGRQAALLWCASGALVVLAWSFVLQLSQGDSRPVALTRMLVPASLFTGVLSCGIFCLLNPWMDARFLPPALRMNAALIVLNILAGVVFLGLGIKGYWDVGGWRSLGMLGATVMVGWLAAWAYRRRS